MFTPAEVEIIQCSTICLQWSPRVEVLVFRATVLVFITVSVASHVAADVSLMHMALDFAKKFRVTSFYKQRTAHSLYGRCEHASPPPLKARTQRRVEQWSPAGKRQAGLCDPSPHPLLSLNSWKFSGPPLFDGFFFVVVGEGTKGTGVSPWLPDCFGP